MPSVSALCVFCGSSNAAAAVYRPAAHQFGQILGARGVRLVYGGGNVGLMGIVANATLAAGGTVTGIIPRHIMAVEVGHSALTELIVVDTMHQRKRKMFEMSDAFVVLPGGVGTLDETLEILSWRTLGLHDKPVVLVNTAEYWTPLIELLDHTVRNGFSATETPGFFSVVAEVDEVLGVLEAWSEPTKPSRQDII